MSLKIEERFQVRAPIDRVWHYLIDPQQVVNCLPGAELTEVQDERTYLGRVKVKVGPVTAGYFGKATILEQDAAERVVRIQAEGRENQGSGSAKMTMTSRMTTLTDGATEVHVSADVDVVGKIVQFGRGMIESVNKQLFRQFTDCVRAHLEIPLETNEIALPLAGAREPAPPTAPPRDAATPPAAPVVTAGGPAVATAPAAPPALTPATAARTTPSGHGPSVIIPSERAPQHAATPPAVAPVRVLPLVFRALWDMTVRFVTRLVERLFRKRPAGA
jgi:uncharacterized protein